MRGSRPQRELNRRRWGSGLHLFHRISGPAVEHDDGEKWWFVEGRVLYYEGDSIGNWSVPDGMVCLCYPNGNPEHDQGKKRFSAPGYEETQAGGDEIWSPG